MSALSAEVSAALRGVNYFPVRHHSPRTSEVLTRFLDALKPSAVLIEAPHDAETCLDVLLDADTEPPVAILGYRTDGEVGSSMFPFAAYSPEYVAMKWARANGAKVQFIDISIGQGLAARRVRPEAADDAEGEEEPRPVDDVDDGGVDVHRELAKARGFRSFEEFWEASFEAPGYQPEDFRRALLEYAELVRHDGHRLQFHRARDAFMASRIAEATAGVDAAKVAVVVGAAHAAALATLDVQPELEATLDETVPTAVTMIPYSFTRLAEQTGYGAGNRAPRYYQRAHEHRCDFKRASLEMLIEFGEHLRLRGFITSLADTIEAYRLATMLADLRGKQAPGLDEVREAAVATMCRGDATHVDGFLWSTVVGHSIGKVAARIGRNSLQQEFWREVKERRLPATDEPARFALKMADGVQVETSVFLHRLRVADIPYAVFQGTQTGGARGAKVETETAGGFAALSRVREGWEAQWTPSTDAALVERIVLGDDLRSVCERALTTTLDKVTNTGGAADVLMESVVCAAPQVMARALQACDRFASGDDDLPSLASACRALSGLVSYGSSRKQSALGDDVLPALCRKTFDRAVLRVPLACDGDDEAVRPAMSALKSLHDIALSQPSVDKQSWLEAARGLLHSYVANPACSGLACGLLYLAQELGDEEVSLLVGQRLSQTSDPKKAASFLQGFFEVNALVLVRSKPVVAALDAFLCAIPADAFKDTLPTLRRAFSPLGQTERRYLLENLLGARKLTGKAAAAAKVINEKDKEKLKAMSSEMAKVMDDLDDLL